MKLVLVILSVFSLTITNNKIDEINKLTKDAEESFFKGEYEKSIDNYKILIDSFGLSNEKVYLNLAHSYLLSKDTLKAIESYNHASHTENNEVKSIALQQLGNINEKKNKLEEALSFYKKSILADNTNNDSKFNYELVKKKIQENQNQNKDNQENQENNKNSDKNQNQKSSKKNQEENKEKEENKNDNEQKKNDNQKQEKQNDGKEESIEQKLKQINMTKKKAEMILDALNNNEFQYIQQLKRKPSKKLDKNKPDW